MITAIGRSDKQALGTVRISMGRDTTEDATTALAEVLAQVVQRHRLLE